MLRQTKILAEFRDQDSVAKQGHPQQLSQLILLFVQISEQRSEQLADPPIHELPSKFVKGIRPLVVLLWSIELHDKAGIDKGHSACDKYRVDIKKSRDVQLQIAS